MPSPEPPNVTVPPLIPAAAALVVPFRMPPAPAPVPLIVSVTPVLMVSVKPLRSSELIVALVVSVAFAASWTFCAADGALMPVV